MILDFLPACMQCHVQFVDTEIIQTARDFIHIGDDQEVLYVSAEVIQRGLDIEREIPFRLAEVERSLHRFKVRTGDGASM